MGLRRFATSLLLTPLLALGACGSRSTCDDGGLAAALAAAAPGSTVELGACTVHGRFTVPAGVTLHGLGPSTSTIASDGLAVILGDGATLASVRVDHGAAHGVVATNVGSATVRDVEVHSTRGRAGLGFADVATLTLTNVTATGPITSETDAQMLPATPAATDTCLYGVVLQRVGHATLTQVSASGFGAAGLVSSASTIAWTGGMIAGDLHVGAWVDGGSATITDVTIDGTLRGFSGNPPYGLAIGGGADVHTSGLMVNDSHQGFGILQDGSSAEHLGLTCTAHPGGGLVAQRTTSLHVGGGSMFDGNAFGAIIAVEAGGVAIDDTMVANTSLASRLLGSWGSTMVGDGVQLVRPSSTATLAGVSLVASGRAGMLVDLGGGAATLLDATRVTTSMTSQYGCVMQNGTGVTPTVLGSMCTRDSVAATADLTAPMLDVVGIVMPSEIPSTGGLVGIVMPSE